MNFTQCLTSAVGAIALVSGIAVASPAAASDLTCRSTIVGKSISGSVIVPAGATCVLQGVTVDGDVKVGSKAVVNVTKKSRVKGNVQADRQRHVLVQGFSRVDGDVQAKNGNSAFVGVAYVDGNVQIEQNYGAIAVGSSRIQGDVQLFSNKGARAATKRVFNNRIGGNLQCKSNSPAPYGYSNKVEGAKEDQCRRL